MAVNLSMFAGAGAQFFNGVGVPLSGGKIYSYLAGTTTPQATFTTNAGNVSHTNPIVLDSAGRVPSGGEIWLTDVVSYKFILKDSADVLIGTYDNVLGNASTAAQISFTGFNGQTGTVDDLADNDGSDWIGFIQPDSDAVARSAQNKMRDFISVKDFGAVGNGIADDRKAIQDCIDYCNSSGGVVYLPKGTYKILDSLVLYTGSIMHGESFRSVAINASLANKSAIRTQYGENPTYTERTFNWDLRDFRIVGTNAANSIGLNFGNVGYANLKDVFIQSFKIGLFCSQRTYYTFFNNLTIQDCEIGADLTSDGGANFFVNANIAFTDYGVKITSGGWSFTSCVVDTGSMGATAFFSVGQNGFAKSANAYLVDVYVEGVDAATTSVAFYNNTVTSGVIGMQRRNITGPITYADIATAGQVIICSWGITTPFQRFWKITFSDNYYDDVNLSGAWAFEGGVVGLLAQDGSSPGSLSAYNVYLNGSGFTGLGIYQGGGSPEGSVTATPGSLYLRTAGFGAPGLYVKETGNGNTGWVAK